MSSYLHIYLKSKDMPAIHAFTVSRNHPLYRAIYENSNNVTYAGTLECKEWYKYNHEHWGGEFEQSKYDSLPTKDEMITKRCTKLDLQSIECIINCVEQELISAKERRNEEFSNSNIKKAVYNALADYFPDKKVQIPETDDDDLSGWNEYIDELQMAIYQLYLFTYPLDDDIEIYCFID